MTNRQKIGLIVLIFILLIAAIISAHLRSGSQTPPPPDVPVQQPEDAQAPTPSPTASIKTLADPIADAQSRITKKPFGIHITPATSPVQPERFSGYHTGTDFETTPAEADAAIPFYAICSGNIVAKRTASGYGAVLVQACNIADQPVTVIYGHISLQSIAKNIGDALAAGEQIGILGHSPDETDGERKHLHVGIHKGTAINILGYVQNPADLDGWLDWQKLQ